MRRFLPLLPLLALVALLAAGCGGGGGGTSGTTGTGSNTGSEQLAIGDVAVIGTSHITKERFDALLDQARRSYQTQHRPFPKPGTAQYTQLQQQAMQFLIQREEYAQKAQELDVKVTDKQIDDRLAQIKKQYFGGSEKRYQDALKQQGLSEDQVRSDIQAQLISEGLFNKVTANVVVSDDAARAYYTQHSEQYTTPQTREVRHILVKKKALADKLYAQLKKKPSLFPKLAKRYSEDPGSKNNGGELKISKGQTVKEFDAVAFKLKTNELSKPVHTQYGWHIIQAIGKIEPAKTTPFDKAKDGIKQQLAQQKKTEAMTTWVEGVKKEFVKRIKYARGYEPATVSTPATTATTPTR